MEAKLEKGKVYEWQGMLFVGWTLGDGSGHAGYHAANYFDMAGRYLGPDSHGIEPVFQEMEAKLEHTPGKWRAKSRHIPDNMEYRREVHVATTAYDVFAIMAPITPASDLHPSGYDYDRIEANARLIAAAPDLLAALKRYVESDAGIADDLTATARAAIAAAEGQVCAAGQNQPTATPTEGAKSRPGQS